MRRGPLLFGTPSTPCSTSVGSFKNFTYDMAHFPALASGSEQACSLERSYKHAVLSDSTTLPAASTDPPSSKAPTDQPPTRRERQFQDLCDEIRTNLYESQFATAKILLSCIPTTAHEAWLQRLAQAMAGETIMAQAQPAPPKPYYKRVFRPHFTDPVPLPTTPAIVKKPVLHTFTAPRPRHYDIWTDRTLAIYTDGPHSQNDHSAVMPQKIRCKKVCRPSSYARPSSLHPRMVPPKRKGDLELRRKKVFSFFLFYEK